MMQCGGATLISFLPGAMQRTAKVACIQCGFHFCGFCALANKIESKPEIIPECGPGANPSDLERHIVDCGSSTGTNESQWWVALMRYVPIMVGLCPVLGQTEALKAQVDKIMTALRGGSPFTDIEGVRRWVPSIPTPPFFPIPKQNDSVQGRPQCNVWGGPEERAAVRGGAGSVQNWPGAPPTADPSGALPQV